MNRYIKAITLCAIGLFTIPAMYAHTIKICNMKDIKHDIRLGWEAWGSDTVITVDGSSTKTYDSGIYCVNKAEIKEHKSPDSAYRPIGFDTVKTGAGIACRDMSIKIDYDGRVWVTPGAKRC